MRSLSEAVTMAHRQVLTHSTRTPHIHLHATNSLLVRQTPNATRAPTHTPTTYRNTHPAVPGVPPPCQHHSSVQHGIVARRKHQSNPVTADGEGVDVGAPNSLTPATAPATPAITNEQQK